MAEIARTFEDAGLPGGAAAAASLLYERLASFKDVETPLSIDEVIAGVLS
jgi:ABC-type spermidine/putrescine transport system permease subunit I